ncbi:MAG: HAMP domain-containing protein [Acidobacteria bacterium]|nr:HAMP domain-containing protein [Acidobacteriota bacterium]
MKISSRLIIILTVSVNAVMLVATFFILRQLEANLLAATQDEIRAHAATLQIALEEDYATGRSLDAQRLINRLSENRSIYGAILFNASGQIEVVSNSIAAREFSYLGEVKQVLETARAVEISRQLNGQDLFSVIAPIKNAGTVVGAIEIAQSISFIRTELVRERRNIALTAASLCVAILLVVSFVLHFNLTRPVQSLLTGAIAIGRGDLSHRVAVPKSSGELVRLATEFNQMAKHLAEQREALAREAEEKIALERKLRHSEQLAALGRLAAGVAHEMGAPLQVIDGRAKQLQDRADSNLEMRQRNLTIIRTQAERIGRIVRQMLNLARPYNLQVAPTKVAQLIQEITDAVEITAATNGVKINVQCDDRIMIEADGGLILQAILNVCQNAIQAMPTGGLLTIECLADPAGSDPLIKISDTGPGIPSEHLEHIFDPFYTTKEVGHGTGLGLAVASRIIAEHGGHIEVANRAEGGAVFYIYLPQLKPDN